MSLERVLSDAEVEAAALRRNGHSQQADSILRLVEEVRTAAADYLEWLPEGAAMLRSGRGSDWLKARRDQWERDGLAYKRGRTWYYRRVCIETRKPTSITLGEARRAS